MREIEEDLGVVIAPPAQTPLATVENDDLRLRLWL